MAAEMQFNMSESEAVQSEGTDMNYWPREASIVENVYVDAEKTAVITVDDKLYLDVYLVAGANSVATHPNNTTTALGVGAELKWRQFPITLKEDSVQAREEATKKWTSFQKRHKHLLTKFVTEEVFEGWRTGSDGQGKRFDGGFAKLFDITAKILKKYAKSTTMLRVKVVLNDEDYATIPNYVPFLEPMSVAKADSVLKFVPSMDKLTRTTGNGGGASAGANNNAAIRNEGGAPAMNVAGGEDDDDLPF